MNAEALKYTLCRDQALGWRFYGNSAVYAINPVSKEVALQLACNVDAEPVKAWQLPAPEDTRRADDYDYVGGDAE